MVNFPLFLVPRKFGKFGKFDSGAGESNAVLRPPPGAPTLLRRALTLTHESLRQITLHEEQP